MRLSPTKKSAMVNYTQSRDRVKVEGNLEVTGTSTLTGATIQTGALGVTGALTCASTIAKAGANGQTLTQTQVTIFQNMATASGAGTGTITLAALIPAGFLLSAVDARITTILAGSGLTTISLGVSSDTDRFATGIAIAAGTTVNSLLDSASDARNPFDYVAATDVLITAAAGVISTGYIRITLHGWTLTPATS